MSVHLGRITQILCSKFPGGELQTIGMDLLVPQKRELKVSLRLCWFSSAQPFRQHAVSAVAGSW